MLALLRRVGQSLEIRVPPSTEMQIIRVTLTKIQGPNRATIGTEADKHIEILREEIAKEYPR